jgi:hypothetical protein
MQVLVGHRDDPLESDRSGLSTALIDMMGPATARALMKDLYRGERVRRVDARLRQSKRAKLMRLDEKRTPLKAAGGARYVAEIDYDSIAYWQEREGRDVWKDRTFVKEYLRDNPDVRVAQATGGASNRVAWTPTVEPRKAPVIVEATRYTPVGGAA